tara:strand:- start:439 stop:786 length:348 start_codon:yes stop_codon:yes gene_type:complete
MTYEVGIEDIAVIIKPLGDGRIETCIYKDPDNVLEEEDLDLAIQVAVTMSAFFELVASDDDEMEVLASLKERLEEKIQEIMDADESIFEEDSLPLYSSEGNILTINKFTKTKGTC